MLHTLRKKGVTKTIDDQIKIFSPLEKTVILCCNGFQTTDTHDALPMCEYFRSAYQEDYPLCEIVPVFLFEASDKKSHRKKLFEQRIENKIQEYHAKGYQIILSGYSFSCSLVAKMAYKHQDWISKVIFIAPIYDCVMNNMIPGYLKFASKYAKLKKKYGKKVSKAIGRQTVQGMPFLLINIFLSVLSNRKYIRKISQDVLLLRGTSDTMSSEHAIKQVQKRLRGHFTTCIYDNMTHTCVQSLRLNGILFEDIFHFAFNTPFYLQEEEVKKEEKEKNRIYQIFFELDPNCDDNTVAMEEQV